MKKWLVKLSLVAMALLLLPIQAVEACCGFIIGRQLTKDGSTLFGRTEDYPYYQTAENTTKTMLLLMPRIIRKGTKFRTNPMVSPILMLPAK